MYITFILILATLVVLTGCAFIDSPQKVISGLEKAYGTKLEFVEKEKDSPEGNYILRDTKRGFNFRAGSRKVSNKHFPGEHKKTYSDYYLDLMRHYQPQALEIASCYEVRFDPPLHGKPARDMDDETYGRHRFAQDNVYIHSLDGLEQTIELFMDLTALYNFEYHENKTLTSPSFPSMKISYLPENETDTSKGVIIHYCHYLCWDIPWTADRSKRKPRYYTPSEEEVRTELYKKWNSNNHNDHENTLSPNYEHGC